MKAMDSASGPGANPRHSRSYGEGLRLAAIDRNPAIVMQRCQHRLVPDAIIELVADPAAGFSIPASGIAIGLPGTGR